ncbi:MAG: hypothetical protein LDL31_11215, partial [Prosthecobacter sp.]|nr:hypothetical protein [Prosthecobacter sp.]
PSVEAELLKLIGYSSGPLVACLPAGPGRRVAQYAQLLTGEPESGLAPKEILNLDAATDLSPTPEPQVQVNEAELARLVAAGFPQASISAPVYPPAAPTAPLSPPSDDQLWRRRMEMEIEILKAQLNRLKVRLGIDD